MEQGRADHAGSKKGVASKVNREDFSALRERHYMQTGGVGLTPDHVLRLAAERRQRRVSQGPGRHALHESDAAELEAFRHHLAALLGASSGEVALLSNVTSGFDLIALGLSWREGDEVLVGGTEHVAGLMPWRLLQERHGVRVVVVPARSGEDWRIDARDVVAALTDRTRVVILSHVSYSTGQPCPATQLAPELKARRILFALDGAQAFGAIPVDVRALGCDVYALAGYKWALGPEGTAAVYISRDWQERLRVHRIGYYGCASLTDDGCFVLHDDARRYMGTTFDRLAFLSWRDALNYMEGIGLESIYRAVQDGAASCRRILASHSDVRMVEPIAGGSGLVCFELQGGDPGKIAELLDRRFKVDVRAVPWPRAVRASVHFYNDESDFTALLAGLQELTAEGASS